MYISQLFPVHGTIRTNTYDTDVKIDFDKIIGMVEKCVGNSNTATNTGIR